MSELVLLHHNEPMTTSETLADGVQLQHKNVLALVRKHLADMLDWGEVAFQTRLNPQGSPTEFAYLNEGQSLFLLTLMKNSPVVVAFKKALVKAFLDLRDRVEHQRIPELGQPLQANHRADLSVSAARTFNAMLRAGRAMGLALPRAVERANDIALRKTGVDVMAEMGVQPEEFHPKLKGEPLADDEISAALREWAVTAGPGPWRMAEIAWQVFQIAPDSPKWFKRVPKIGFAMSRLGFRKVMDHIDGKSVRRWHRTA